MDSSTFTTLVHSGRLDEATQLLQESQVSLDPKVLVRTPALALSVMALATQGSDHAVRAIAAAMGREGREAIGGTAGILAEVHRAACRRYISALQRSDLPALCEPWEIMCHAPHITLRQRAAIRACYHAALDRAESRQALVLHRVHDLTIRDVLVGAEHGTIMRTIGTVWPFTALDSMLRVLATAHGCPGLGDELLAATLRRAQWPMIACLSTTLATLYLPTLIQWLLDPGARADFPETANNWVVIAATHEPEGHAEEPPESFRDD